MSRALTLASLSLVFLLSACGLGQSGSDLRDVLPDDRIKVNLPTPGGAKGDGERDWATFYLFTAEITEDINGMAGFVIGMVNRITLDYPPSYVNESESSATWGPWADTLDPVFTQLEVTHDLETDAYTWGFDQWPKDDATDVHRVIDGQVDPGATHEVNSGSFLVDFTQINELDPTEEATGTFEVDYDIRDDGVDGTAIFSDFGPTALDASYAYWDSDEGDGNMDLTMQADIDGGGAMETLAIHSRWLATGAGRSDVSATGGDLGDLTFYVSECWSTSFERVYYTDSFKGGKGTVEGDVSACAYPEAEYSAVTL
jgi:hypothetical protein